MKSSAPRTSIPVLKRGTLSRPFLKVRDLRGAGFTLLELLIVLIIIAVLATVAFTQFGRSAAQSSEAKAITDLGSLRTYEQAYHSLRGSYTDLDEGESHNLRIDYDNDGTDDVVVDVNGAPNYKYSVNKDTGLATATKQGSGGHRTCTMNLDSGTISFP